MLALHDIRSRFAELDIKPDFLFDAFGQEHAKRVDGFPGAGTHVLVDEGVVEYDAEVEHMAFHFELQLYHPYFRRKYLLHFLTQLPKKLY